MYDPEFHTAHEDKSREVWMSEKEMLDLLRKGKHVLSEKQVRQIVQTLMSHLGDETVHNLMWILNEVYEKPLRSFLSLCSGWKDCDDEDLLREFLKPLDRFRPEFPPETDKAGRKSYAKDPVALLKRQFGIELNSQQKGETDD